jgi:hypothetical protein
MSEHIHWNSQCSSQVPLQKDVPPQFLNFNWWVPLQILIVWFKLLGGHRNFVLPNYNQKRVMFSLGDLHCRLPAPVIKSRSNVRSGNASVKVTTSAVIVSNFERKTERVPWPSLSNLLVKPSVLQLIVKLDVNLARTNLVFYAMI